MKQKSKQIDCEDKCGDTLLVETIAIRPRCRLDDPSRLEALTLSGLLDSNAQNAIDAVVQNISRGIGSPIAYFTAVVVEEQIFISSAGLPEPLCSAGRSSADNAYCRNVVLSKEPVVIENADLNPLVSSYGLSKFGLVSYLGVPVFSGNGEALGSLCVCDTKPRAWTEGDLSFLQINASLVTHELKNRALLTELNDQVSFNETILQSSPDCVKLLDKDGYIQFFSDAGCRLMEINGPNDVIGQAWPELWPKESQHLAKEAVAAAGRGQQARFEAFCPSAKNTPKWWDVIVNPTFDAIGEVNNLVAVSRDITERKNHEDHVQMLMGEINHRSKNMLAVVQSMVRQTAKTSPQGEFLDKVDARLQSLSRSQDLVISGGWKVVSLEKMIVNQLSNFIDLSAGRLKIEGPAVEIGPSAAQGVGMALHELATNSVKYGSLSNSTGTITINWEFDSSCSNAGFRMRWIEEGGPEVAPPKRRGFGRTVIEQLAGHAVDGDVTIDFAPSGVCWELKSSRDHFVEILQAA